VWVSRRATAWNSLMLILRGLGLHDRAIFPSFAHSYPQHEESHLARKSH
jgi:hypothetical protein